jgi:hypothetical protein
VGRRQSFSILNRVVHIVTSGFQRFNKAPLHVDIRENSSIAPPLFISALYDSEWSASRPGRFNFRERASDINLIWYWVGPRIGVNAAEQRKIPCSCRLLKPGRPARSPSLYWLRYPCSCPIVEFVVIWYSLFMCVFVFYCIWWITFFCFSKTSLSVRQTGT